MNRTGISWADYTWNPVTGCTKVSEGCRNCYAEAWAKRWGRSFEVTIHPERLEEIKRIPSGAKVFVNSMSDLFHEEVPFDFIADVLVAIASRPDVTFQILTKRPERMMKFQNSYVEVEFEGPRSLRFPSNAWLGVTVESRRHLHRMITLIFDIVATTKFVSFEPLLEDMGEVRFYDTAGPGYYRGINWIIVGGESGPNRRPFKLEWAYSLLRQAREQGVKFFFKQTGDLRPGSLGGVPEDLIVREFPDAAESTMEVKA